MGATVSTNAISHGSPFPDLTTAFGSSRQFRLFVALTVVGVALALGVLADLLFYNAAAGANVLVWNAALITGLLVMRRRFGPAILPIQLACLGGSLVFSATPLWRASETLIFFNLLAAATLLLLAVTLPPGAGLRRVGPLRLFQSGVLAFVELLTGVVAIMAMRCWREPSRRLEAGELRYFARATLLAAVLLLIFGGLFIAADAVIEAQVSRLADIPLDRILSHAFLIGVATWLAAGAFWGFLAVEPSATANFAPTEAWRVRTAENAIVLGALAVLFAAFVLVQARYLFGGEDVVLRSTSLTYAQYARRGFFELVAVAALLLPVLMTLDWARTRTGAANAVFRGLASALVLLLFAIMASALQRLRIYEEAFGLTETRLYVVVALFWLGIVFAWFLWNVGRGRRDDFVAGAIASAALVLLAINLLNPDGFIAANNTTRLDSGKTFDAGHALSLSADAVPTLVRRLDELPAADACLVATGLLNRWLDADNPARSWNLARQRAIDAVAANRATLLATCSARS